MNRHLYKIFALLVVCLLVTLGLIVTQPLGPKLQKAVTTEANLGNLKVIEVKRMNDQGTPVHRVLTSE